ncbi:MAG TPA: beta-galactosidase trimerization domain-containing protein, partial [bacterium]|nr:beta-galactosidase trimerization domain-containing protein [bacterium]
NYAFGFERMHTWLALAHSQIPVDFLSEKMIEEGWLSKYRVAYFSGTALTEKAAEQIKLWVLKGGVLILTAGAGMKDQFNRPMKILDSILPAERSCLIEIARYLNSGRYLDSLSVADTVVVKETRSVLDVLSVKQTLKPKPGSAVLATFSDASPAIVVGKAGRGNVYCYGFLPAIAYMRKALIARNQLMKDTGEIEKIQEPAASKIATDQQLLKRAFEPWQYPEEYRNVICMPVHQAGVNLPVICSAALVDATVMDSEKGSVLVLSNYTFQPIAELTLEVKPLRRVKRVESVHCGQIRFSQHADRIRFSLPLQETDFVKIYYQ